MYPSEPRPWRSSGVHGRFRKVPETDGYVLALKWLRVELVLALWPTELVNVVYATLHGARRNMQAPEAVVAPAW